MSLVVSIVQYYFLKRWRIGKFIELSTPIRKRGKFTEDVEEELKRDLQLDSTWSLMRELWMFKLVTNLVPQLRVLISLWNSEPASKTATPTGTPAKRLSPSEAASSVLIWQGLRGVLIAVVLMLLWNAVCTRLGTSHPIFIVTSNHMHNSDIDVGDVLIMQWGRGAIDDLRAGDILAYRYAEEDHDFLLSRVMSVHKEGNSQGVKVVNGDTWIATRADGYKYDDRTRRGHADTSEDQFVNGRDESYPGRVWAKLPWIGTPVVALGGHLSIVSYLGIVAFGIYSIILAGAEARRVRPKPRIITK